MARKQLAPQRHASSRPTRTPSWACRPTARSTTTASPGLASPLPRPASAKLVTPGLDAAPGEHRPEADPGTQHLSLDFLPGEREPQPRRGLHPRAPLGLPGRQRHLLRLRQRGRDPRAGPLHHPGRRGQRVLHGQAGAWPTPGCTSTTSRTRFDTFRFDNPFRVTDSHRRRRLPGPGYGSTKRARVRRAGPAARQQGRDRGRRRHASSSGKKTPPHRRRRARPVEAERDPFIPWTTNTAIKTPGGRARHHRRAPGHDARRQDRHHRPFTASSPPASRDALGLNARYRRYDHDNKTPRYSLPDGYVRFDAVWEDIPRITRALRLHQRHLRRLRHLRQGRCSGRGGLEVQRDGAHLPRGRRHHRERVPRGRGRPRRLDRPSRPSANSAAATTATTTRRDPRKRSFLPDPARRLRRPTRPCSAAPTRPSAT